MANGERRCEACGVRARPLRNSVLWWIPAVLTYALLAFGLALAAVSPPLNLLLVPCLFFVNAALVGFFSEKLAREARCPACRRVHAPLQRAKTELPEPRAVVNEAP